ncbi:hypothetical protein P167DRAFT_547675 [Morchella conica CCBAS932]|uniref:Uncharacterized protein n=1 Tax=Morchella conica CCBAS932 TaxID=1392247 RepID=A0A3N4KHA3_9PEZI|nr:hypothetical protein P167DRAFT_547675 [Morchella conica CCBAS932]
MPHLFQTRPAMAYNFAQRNIAHIRALLQTLMSDIVDAEFAVAELRTGAVEPAVLEALVDVETGIAGVLMLYGEAVVELEYVRRRWPSIDNPPPGQIDPPTASPARLLPATPNPPQATRAPTHPNRPPAAPKLRTGSFHTSEVTPHGAAIGATNLITFSPPYPTAPGIITGLRLVSIAGSGTLRATTHARNITPKHFSIHAHALTHCPSSASWLEIAPDDADLQHGTSSTTQDHPAMEKKRETAEKRANVRVQTWAQGVSAAGFDLCVASGMGSMLFAAEVSWAACAADRPDTVMGTFQTSVPLPRRETGFEAGRFRDEPVKVFLAINRFAASMGSDVNLNSSDIPKEHNDGLSQR